MRIRTNTKDAVEKWVSACIGGKAKENDYIANSASSNGTTFYSYSTPIAKYMGGKGVFLLNAKKYSVTTSKLQGIIRRAVPSGMLAETDEPRRVAC